MLHVVTVLIEGDDGTIIKHQREFGGFKRDMKAMAFWLLELQVSLVVMESTGIYWKSAHAHIERAGILAMVVNAHFIKYVSDRKTDMVDSEWLAVLARFGLVRGSFIPPKDLRELCLISRYRRKLSQMLSSENNRMQKILDDGGIKLGAVVSDIKSVTARAMVSGLVAGKSISELLGMARGSLKNKREDLAAPLEVDLSPRHFFILTELHESVTILEQKLARFDAYLIEAMRPYQWAFELLQTIPGIDATSSAMILIEIGDDISRFGDADRLAS
jgi:transposase